MALWIGAGIGGRPGLRQRRTPRPRGEHPDQPQVFLLNSIRSSVVRPCRTAIELQKSPETVSYEKQVPSAFCLGLRSGSSLRPQQMRCPSIKLEHSPCFGLYLVKSLGSMPHLDASDPQESPATTVRVWQVPSEFGSAEVSGSVPWEQQTVSPEIRVLQKSARGLKRVRSASEIPHDWARCQPHSPGFTLVVRQSARAWSR